MTFHKIVKRKDGVRGNSNTTEYILTLDTAKEIALMENSPQGQKVRTYFILCEKKLMAPQTILTPAQQMAQGLLAAQQLLTETTELLEEAAIQLTETTEVLTEKQDFIDTVIAPAGSLLNGKAAVN